MKRIGVWGLVLFAVVAVALGNRYISARRGAPSATLEEMQARYGEHDLQTEVAGIRVNYRDEGAGPVLVLLHGSFGSLRMFDEMVRELPSMYRVIRYDQPPTGLSGPVPDDFTLTSEDFLGRLLDKLGVGKVSVLGTSSGGIIAYRFAAAYPDRVNALILSNVPPSAPVDNAGALKRLPITLRWSIRTCFKYSRPWSKVCWRDFLDSNFWRKPRVTEELVAEYYDLNRRKGAGEFTSMTPIVREDDQVITRLNVVKAPTLLIWGMQDPVLLPDAAELLAARLTSTETEIVSLDDVSHYPPLEAPSDVAAATHRYLQSALAK